MDTVYIVFNGLYGDQEIATATRDYNSAFRRLISDAKVPYDPDDANYPSIEVWRDGHIYFQCDLDDLLKGEALYNPTISDPILELLLDYHSEYWDKYQKLEEHKEDVAKQARYAKYLELQKEFAG